MRELTINEVQEVNGGIFQFVAGAIAAAAPISAPFPKNDLLEYRDFI